MSRPPVTATAAGLGAVTGARSFTGLGALAAAGERTMRGRPAKIFGHRVVRPLLLVLAATEFVADKLPTAPSRLQAPGLAGRLVFAAGCGAAVALADQQAPPDDLTRVSGGPDGEAVAEAAAHRPVDMASVVTSVAVATAAAAATAWVGVRWRAWASGRFASDWPGAALEDALTVGLAAAVTRR